MGEGAIQGTPPLLPQTRDTTPPTKKGVDASPSKPTPGQLAGGPPVINVPPAPPAPPVAPPPTGPEPRQNAGDIQRQQQESWTTKASGGAGFVARYGSNPNSLFDGVPKEATPGVVLEETAGFTARADHDSGFGVYANIAAGKRQDLRNLGNQNYEYQLAQAGGRYTKNGGSIGLEGEGYNNAPSYSDPARNPYRYGQVVAKGSYEKNLPGGARVEFSAAGGYRAGPAGGPGAPGTDAAIAKVSGKATVPIAGPVDVVVEGYVLGEGWTDPLTPPAPDKPLPARRFDVFGEVNADLRVKSTYVDVLFGGTVDGRESTAPGKGFGDYQLHTRVNFKIPGT